MKLDDVKLNKYNLLIVELQQNVKLRKKLEWYISQASPYECLIQDK